MYANETTLTNIWGQPHTNKKKNKKLSPQHTQKKIYNTIHTKSSVHENLFFFSTEFFSFFFQTNFPTFTQWNNDKMYKF